MDITSMFKARSAWDQFRRSHPKFPAFVDAVKSHGFMEGSEIAIAIRHPDGSEQKTGIRVKASDLELLKMLMK